MSAPLVQIRSTQGKHWYKSDGKPCYEIPNKSKPGEMRKVDIRDARKLNLLPSVTTVTDCIRNEGLERWKYRQYMEAALTLPRNEGETDQAFISRVIDDANKVSADAMAFGTKCHDAIESYAEHRDKSKIDQSVWPFITGAAEFIDKNLRTILHTEHTFASPLGYGGKIDMIGIDTEGRVVLIDWKTKTTQIGKEIEAYPSYGIQLAAYKNGLSIKVNRTMNIILSSTEAGRPIHIKEWDNTAELFDVFLATLKIWIFQNNYNPVIQDLTKGDGTNG